MPRPPGYEFIIQGMAGVMDITGEPGGAPQKTGVAYADIMTGLYAVIGIQAALAARASTGRGQHLDVALLDVMVATLANQAMNYLATGVSPTRLGNAHPNIAPYEVFPTSDGWFILAVGNDAQFARFCAVVGLDLELQFATNEQRVAARDRLAALIAPITRSWRRDMLLAALTLRDVPAGPINTIAEAFADPQVIHRRMAITVAQRMRQIRSQLAPAQLAVANTIFDNYPMGVSNPWSKSLKMPEPARPRFCGLSAGWATVATRTFRTPCGRKRKSDCFH
jgi:crotonobetainyl-CoA:carnitine CoA-transferase CaiB-like acyl-CoA transferase